MKELIMKQPKLNNLKLDKAETKKIRQQASHSKKIKITINFDKDVLDGVKELSDSSGVPYQTLLNKILKEALLEKKSEMSRLDKLELEIKKLKKKFAA